MEDENQEETATVLYMRAQKAIIVIMIIMSRRSKKVIFLCTYNTSASALIIECVRVRKYSSKPLAPSSHLYYNKYSGQPTIRTNIIYIKFKESGLGRLAAVPAHAR